VIRIAVYSDIHGNTPGIEAVHNEIDKYGSIDLEICLGDLIYGGPGTSEIIDMIQKRNVIFLRGNHDEDIINFQTVLPSLPESHRISAKIWNDWLISRLTEEELRYLSEVPLSYSMVLPDNREITFCHSLPDNTGIEFLGPDVIPLKRIEIFSNISSDILCTGHWHKPVIWNWNSLQVICPGSVGLRNDGTVRWLLIEADDNFVNIQPKSVRYNVQEFIKLALENSMPEILHPGRINT
jgi:predicted phosphodiesterase